jgi:phosphonate metabolism protein PhnN/1,5-bisphosphokinase (PRPP-forming)
MSRIFLIVGNSGSGKDSLIKAVQDRWPADRPPIKVPQRYITRPPHETEPFISVTENEFLKLRAEGKLLLEWHIYGLYYGVPKEVLDWEKQGHVVIINVSRNVIPEARKLIPGVKVIFVHVPFEITMNRVKSRGRESENDPQFQERIKRAESNQELPDADFVVDNSGPLEIGSKVLMDFLLQF